jgi:hypothetical protein
MIRAMSIKCLIYYVLCELWKHWHNFVFIRFHKYINYPVWLFKTSTELLNFEMELIQLENIMRGKDKIY